MTTPLQYSTIATWIDTLPSWVPPRDQVRIAAYDKYEEIYTASEEGYETVMRGDNDNPVFMPTARTVVNTVDRYTAPGFGYRVDSLSPDAPDEDGVAIAEQALDNLFTREQFISKFNSEKRKGLYRGDWLFHIIGDDTKPAGRRLKISVIHPGSWFPVYEDDITPGGDPDRLIRVHIAEQIRMNNQERVSRLTYERLFDEAGNQTGIQVSHGIFDPKDWASNGVVTPKEWIIQPTLLPPTIPAIPVYSFKNGDSTERFGTSELMGLESVLLGINQTVSDEDMTLALDGIGVYATDGGPPIDQQGNEVDWIMGPGRVLTNANGLKRINGAGSVTPYGDHYDRMYNAIKHAVGLSDVAIGKVDTATAESGVALSLELGPIMSYTSNKDQHITDVARQMFHDLCFWLQEYEDLPLLQQGEGGPTPRVRITPTYRDKIPPNQKQVVEQVFQLRSAIPPLISLQTAHKMLKAAGVPIEDNEMDLLAQEAGAQAATTDPALAGAEADANADARARAELE